MEGFCWLPKYLSGNALGFHRVIAFLAGKGIFFLQRRRRRLLFHAIYTKKPGFSANERIHLRFPTELKDWSVLLIFQRGDLSPCSSLLSSQRERALMIHIDFGILLLVRAKLFRHHAAQEQWKYQLHFEEFYTACKLCLILMHKITCILFRQMDWAGWGDFLIFQYSPSEKKFQIQFVYFYILMWTFLVDFRNISDLYLVWFQHLGLNAFLITPAKRHEKENIQIKNLRGASSE